MPSPTCRWRLSGLGPRFSDTVTDSSTITAGLKGKLFGTGWTYGICSSSYARLDQDQRVSGYFFAQPAQPDDEAPSMLVGFGVPTCVGTPGMDASTAIANCGAPQYLRRQRPGLFPRLPNVLPWPPPAPTTTPEPAPRGERPSRLTCRARRSRRRVATRSSTWASSTCRRRASSRPTRSSSRSRPCTSTAAISQETCTGDTNGHYSNTDIFGELFVPLLKNLPLVQSLNVDLGVRYSDYTLSGSTTKGTMKGRVLKPIADLLLRATYAQVYRVGTIEDLFGAPTITSAVFIDPCNRLTTAQPSRPHRDWRAPASVYRPTAPSPEANGQVTGLITSNPDLRSPETGRMW